MSPPRHARAHDVLVIGAGIVGAATALAAAERGASVGIVERSPGGPALGSSKGATRIYVPAAYPDAAYLDMGLRALARWRGIEAEAGASLLVPTGALSRGAFASAQMASLREAGVEAELVSAAWARENLGVELPDDAPILHQTDAGVIRAERALATVLGLAERAGAELHRGEAAIAIAPGSGEAVVETTRGSLGAAAVVVAAGPWSQPLLSTAGIEVDQRVSVQSVAYFDCRRPRSAPPVAVVDYEDDEPYGCADGRGGLKAALHALGPAPPSPEAPGPVSPEAVARVSEWSGSAYAALEPVLRASETCLYTNTGDERFAIERHGRIVSVSACNGQGFQLAPESGRIAADLALDRTATAISSGEAA